MPGIPNACRWQVWGSPGCFQDCGLVSHIVCSVADLITPHVLYGLLVLCPGAVVGSEALGWFDHSWGLAFGISLSAWIRVATGLPEQQMVAAWGPAIRPSGQLFTHHHDDRKVSKKILCDSRVGGIRSSAGGRARAQPAPPQAHQLDCPPRAHPQSPAS